ncbi:MAG: (2Fe-2S) ferredoxin domain-containing protein [Deltaproteobacteria bacterium]|nr:(2Fe-2S) ferredoxin domain-containing protein [Deltaproteobacteria bacterium]MBW2352195.1 (2Fe-2S) ferredoxin domain-containing protein [Deltaproteobacteria bacterium]HDZ90512.1 (2Fe-2S) ferredoxin domain-containing protein [Deltaproteobacteria bacterium]
MAEKGKAPFVCHIFVCTNDRGGKRKSCADNNSRQVRSRLKEIVNDRGWKGKARVSQSGCMGLCAKGSNVIIYPQGIWFSGVLPEDVEEIAATVVGIVEGD